MKNIQLHMFELLQQVQDSPSDQEIRIKLANHLAGCVDCAENFKLSKNLQRITQVRFASPDRGARSAVQMIESIKQRVFHRQFFNRLSRPLPGIAWITIGTMLVMLLSLGIALLRPKSIVPLASFTQTATFTPSPTEKNQGKANCRTISHTINQRDTLLAIAIYFNVPLDTLYKENNIENNPLLKPGKSLVIPFCGWTPPQYAKSPDQYGVTPLKDCPIVTYSVQQGDTLEAISSAFNIPAASIVSVNQLENSSVLSPGKSLNITLCKNP